MYKNLNYNFITFHNFLRIIKSPTLQMRDRNAVNGVPRVKLCVLQFSIIIQCGT